MESGPRCGSVRWPRFPYPSRFPPPRGTTGEGRRSCCWLTTVDQGLLLACFGRMSARLAPAVCGASPVDALLLDCSLFLRPASHHTPRPAGAVQVRCHNCRDKPCHLPSPSGGRALPASSTWASANGSTPCGMWQPLQARSVQHRCVWASVERLGVALLPSCSICGRRCFFPGPGKFRVRKGWCCVSSRPR